MADCAIRLLSVCCVILERELQRHLYLPRSANGMGYKPKAGRAVIEAFVGLVPVRVAPSGYRGLSRGRELVEVLILKDLIARDVETCGVGQVVHIKGVFKVVALGQTGHFNQRDICAFLSGLAEDVALPGGEAGLDSIACGYRRCQRAGGGEQGKGEASGVKSGRITGAKSY